MSSLLRDISQMGIYNQAVVVRLLLLIARPHMHFMQRGKN